ncbi:MAG: hypothetical protein ACLPN1_05970 [Dissulfurispiraceae bacterium]
MAKHKADWYGWRVKVLGTFKSTVKICSTCGHLTRIEIAVAGSGPSGVKDGA